MSDHVRELLLLRDGSADGELLYRAQVMRLLGAVQEPGLPGLDMVHRVRRAEGTIVVPHGIEDGETNGLVMFAIGEDGRGALADVRSKSGQVSARSLLVTRGVDFVILVTTGDPSDVLLEAAEAKSDLFYLSSVLRRRIWVMGVPEIVERAEEFLVVRGAVPAKKGLWGWFSRLITPEDEYVLASPLQLRLKEFDRVDRGGEPAEVKAE